MRRFTQAWPNVDVELHESHDDTELADLVERGILDVAFVQLPLDNAWIETELLLQDDYVLVTAADSPFGSKRVPSLREIASQPLIGYRSCRATEIVVDQIRAAGGVEPHFVFRSDENGVVQGLARSGIGVAVLPRLAVDPNDDRGPDHQPEPEPRQPPDRHCPSQGPLPLGGGEGLHGHGARSRRRDLRRALGRRLARFLQRRLAEVGVELRLPERLGEVEALAEGAAAFQEQRHLRGMLDALGDALRPERTSEADERVDEADVESGSSSRSTKGFAILTASSGKLSRCLSDERPVPKSSRTSWTPSSRSSAIRLCAASRSHITSLSVISSIRLSAGIRASKRARATSSASERSASSEGRGSPRR